MDGGTAQPFAVFGAEASPRRKRSPGIAGGAKRSARAPGSAGGDAGRNRRSAGERNWHPEAAWSGVDSFQNADGEKRFEISPGPSARPWIRAGDVRDTDWSAQ